MIRPKLELILMPDLFAVSRLDKDEPIPAWALSDTFMSITRTADELSVVCPQSRLPDGLRCERNCRCLHVAGALDFSLIGIAASLVAPLAKAGISVLVISTHKTDYLLVKENDLANAVVTLVKAGHRLQGH